MTPPALLVYLSGNVRKGSEDLRPPSMFWSEEDERRIAHGVRGAELTLLNPARHGVQGADYHATFGCDLHLVRISDAVLVDARGERGVGVGAEMMFARYAGTPVITLCPPNSFYRRDIVRDVAGVDLRDWVHPFVAGLSDRIAADLDEAVRCLNQLVSDGLRRRDRPGIDEAIAYYHRSVAARNAANHPGAAPDR